MIQILIGYDSNIYDKAEKILLINTKMKNMCSYISKKKL
jgi:hypothetical protein